MKISFFFILIFLISAKVFSDYFNDLVIDLGNIDPLTSAIFRGVTQAFELNQQGLDALTANDFERAEQLFRQASSIVPIYSSPRNNLGVVFFRTEREAEAANIWRTIIQSDPEYVEAKFNLSLYYFRIQDFNSALNILQKAYSKQPNNEAIWALYAYILTLDEQTDRAKDILKRKVPNFQALRMLGEIYAVERNFETARFFLEQLRVVTNPNRDFFETLAAVYNELNLFENTISLFEEATARRDRISDNFRITYAWALFETGQEEKATAIFRRLFSSDKTNRRVQASLIYMLTNKQKFEEALHILHEISLFASDEVMEHIQELKRQVLFASQNLCDTEGGTIENLEGLDIYSIFNLALSYHISGNTQRAKILYEKVLSKNRRFSMAWNNLGVIFAANGEIERAIRAYRRATGRRSNISDGYVNLVNTFWITQDLSSARRWLRRGLRREAENHNLLYLQSLLNQQSKEENLDL